MLGNKTVADNMTTEINQEEREVSIDSKIGKVRDWCEMKEILDSSINDSNKRYLLLYFHAQRNIVDGRIKKAREKFNRMDKWAKQNGYNNFSDFEDDNEELLKIIDLAVRGETHRDKPKLSGF